MENDIAIGVDLGGTNIRAAVVGGEGKILRKLKASSAGDPIRALAGMVAELRGQYPGVRGVGLGTAGLVDRRGLRVIHSPNIPALTGRSFRSLNLGLPLVVENDANAAALGERWMGAGREFQDFVLFTLGTGIGGGIVQGGRLLGVAAEVGHMVIERDGERCSCGNNGCLEQYAAARAIVQWLVREVEGGRESLLLETMGGRLHGATARDVAGAAREGDPLAREALRRAGRALGVGIANMVNLLAPEAVILTGGLVGAWDIYVEEAVREASRRSMPGLFEGLRILPSALGADDAGVLGAAALVLENA
jgi:glucokinase